MVTATKKSRKVVRFLALSAAVFVPLALLAVTIHCHRIWLAARLENHLEQAPEDEVAARLEQLAGLDDAGLPGLVDALHHDSRTRRRVAKHLLDVKLDAWRQLPADQSGKRLLSLVLLLAQRRQHSSSEALRVSADLALQILSWPPTQTSRHHTDIAFSCEQILSAARRAGVIAAPIDSGERYTISPSGEMGTSMEGPLALGLPPRSPPLPPADVPLGPSDEPTDASASLVESSHGAPSIPVAQSAATLIALSDTEVIARISDETWKSAAEKELQRRGFSQLDIRLAHAASDPDPVRREQLVQSLPQLAGVDSRSWLLLLLHDESPRVRAAAARWLATSADPELREHLRKLALQETDETVREALRRGNSQPR